MQTQEDISCSQSMALDESKDTSKSAPVDDNKSKDSGMTTRSRRKSQDGQAPTYTRPSYGGYQEEEVKKPNKNKKIDRNLKPSMGRAPLTKKRATKHNMKIQKPQHTAKR